MKSHMRKFPLPPPNKLMLSVAHIHIVNYTSLKVNVWSFHDGCVSHTNVINWKCRGISNWPASRTPTAPTLGRWQTRINIRD